MSSLPTCESNRTITTYDLRITETTAIALFDVLGRIAGSHQGPRGLLSTLRWAMRDAGVPDHNQTVRDGYSSIYYTDNDTRLL